VVGLSESSTWTTKDSCTYIYGNDQYSEAGEMPLILAYDQSNAGEDEVLIHYLEW